MDCIPNFLFENLFCVDLDHILNWQLQHNFESLLNLEHHVVQPMAWGFVEQCCIVVAMMKSVYSDLIVLAGVVIGVMIDLVIDVVTDYNRK